MHPVRKIERNGVDLFFLHVPKPGAPLVILSHGFPGNSYDWTEQLPELEKDFEIVGAFMLGTYDGRPVGKDRLQADSLIEDVAEIIREVDPTGERPLYLIGHDLGCFFNVALAEKYGGRVRGIVHINGLGLQQYYARLFAVSQWLKSYYVLLLQFTFFQKLVAHGMPRFFLKWIYRLCQIRPGDEMFLRDKRVLTSIYIYKVLFRRTRRFIGMPIARIPVPALFIWGNRDHFLNIPRKSEVRRFYENAEIRIVQGGHWVNRSSPGPVNRILRKTLTQWREMSVPS